MKHRWLLEYDYPAEAVQLTFPGMFEEPQASMRIWLCTRCGTRQSVTCLESERVKMTPTEISACDGRPRPAEHFRAES